MARPVLVPDALSDPAHVEAMRLIAEGASVAVIPAGQGKKKRSPNWFPWEDLMVAKAWVNVSMDASIGCNQTVAKFWRRVQQKFMLQFLSYQVRESHDGGDKDHGGRTASQITNRFMKVMKAEMALFNKYFKEIKDENPSGVPYKQHVKLAVERYNHLNKDPFKFQHCVPTFHKCPKFCPFENDDARIRMMGRDSLHEVDDEEQEESIQTANHVGGVMGGNLERPIGRKAAKKIARTEKKRKSYTSKVEASKTSPDNSTLTEEESSNTSVTIADAMTTLSNAVQANSYFDRMERMVRLNAERGNHADADRTMVELNAFMAAEGRSTLAAARNASAQVAVDLQDSLENQADDEDNDNDGEVEFVSVSCAVVPVAVTNVLSTGTYTRNFHALEESSESEEEELVDEEGVFTQVGRRLRVLATTKPGATRDLVEPTRDLVEPTPPSSVREEVPLDDLEIPYRLSETETDTQASPMTQSQASLLYTSTQDSCVIVYASQPVIPLVSNHKRMRSF